MHKKLYHDKFRKRRTLPRGFRNTSGSVHLKKFGKKGQTKRLGRGGHR